MSRKAPPRTVSHPYTCIACNSAFRNADLQREHMRSAWHSYNLMRRVSLLPPISADLFNEKSLRAEETKREAISKATFEQRCNICRKTYYSQNSYDNHLSSKKHKTTVAALARSGKASAAPSTIASSTFSLGDPTSERASLAESDAEDDVSKVTEGLGKTDLNDTPTSPTQSPAPSTEPQSGTETPIANGKDGEVTLSTCLFCNYKSPSSKLNVTHMERIHGFFIPEKTYLVDLDGLLGALKTKVFEEHQCLACHKVKDSTFAVQAHMKDKGHCTIPYFTEEEQLAIGDFYDFRSTYSDGEESENEVMEDATESGDAKNRPESAAGDDDDGWETDSSASSVDSEEIGSVPMELHFHQYQRLGKHPHHSHTDPRHHHQRDGWHSHAHKRAHAVYYDEYELHLPSGRAVGHRSFARYYRQHLTHHSSPQERVDQLAIKYGLEGDDLANIDKMAIYKARLSRTMRQQLGIPGELMRQARKSQHRVDKNERKDRAAMWAQAVMHKDRGAPPKDCFSCGRGLA